MTKTKKIMITTDTIKQWIGKGRMALFGTALTLALGGEIIQAADAPPNLINYQGYLVDSGGVALGASAPINYKVQFKVFDAQTGGNLFYSEEQVITIDNGYFNTFLGESTADNPDENIYSKVFKNITTSPGDSGTDSRYIQITPDYNGNGNFEESEIIAPRLRFLSTPYSMLSKRATEADKLTASSSDILVASGTGLTATGSLTVSGNIQATGFTGYGITPIGGIIMWSGANEPPGWAICNGQTKNGQTTPDLTGRFIVGAGQAHSGAPSNDIVGKDYNMGDKAGENEVILSEGQMPVHKHGINIFGDTSLEGTITMENDGAHSHNYKKPIPSRDGGDSGWWLDNDMSWGNASTGSSGSHKHTLNNTLSVSHDISATANNTGNGEAHENRPPYYALAYIMRVQ